MRVRPTGEEVFMRKPIGAVAIVAVAALGLAACGGGSSSGSGSGGSSGKTLIISTDLPMQGSSKDASDSTINAINLYLDQINHKAGKYTVKLQEYDDSTAAAGQWDPATCSKNAQAHVANKDEVAVMGTFNSGCAILETPILNQDPSGPMLMVSHANTNPGLTKAWNPGEPQKYFPSGERSYARVVTTDDYQGTADADFAKAQGVKKVYILNDDQVYGQGVAKAFQTQAQKDGITIAGNTPYDSKQPNYTALMNRIKATGSDMLFVGGIYDNNGGQLIKDKVAVLGDNTQVKFMAPDGWTGYPEFLKQSISAGAYLSFAGLSLQPLEEAGGAGAKFIAAYKAKYSADPVGAYPLYGVAAIQAILQAVEKSDGTRKGVRDAVFEGSGIDIPAAQSVLGKDIKIDPATGDVNAKDISIEVVKGGQETFLKAQPVS
jgi:branched-chain amino acid transport system substrate-binding protein